MPILIIIFGKRLQRKEKAANFLSFTNKELLMPAQLWIVKMEHPGVLLKLIREPESIMKEREHMENI